MFRRRPRIPRSGMPGGRAKILLSRAHRLLADGAYLPAGQLFEELAEGAQQRRIPRAPFLFLQAGRAYLYGGEQLKGVNLLKRGLGLLKEAERWGELDRVGNRVAVELSERGHPTESQQIAAWIAELLPEAFDPPIPQQPLGEAKRPVLPTHCPQCGGAVDPQAIVWLDESTGECLYCGSPIRAGARGG